MRHMKKAFLILMALVIVIVGGCGMNGSEISRNVVYKPRDVVENDISDYLKKKYNKDFDVAVMDSPNHIYSSYSADVYPDDDRTVSFQASIVYTDENNYNVTDDYFMYSISGDLEEWFIELADPYIDSNFKVFWRPYSFGLPSDYDGCKTAEDFLKLSPTSSYYGLRFLIVLPSQVNENSLTTITDSIPSKMLERQIRGQVTTIIYTDDVVYNRINSKKDERYFWTNQYRNIFCTSTIREDFSFSEAKIQKGGFWHLDNETYNKEILNDN